VAIALSRGVGSRLINAVARARYAVQRLGWTHAALWLCSAIGRRASVHFFVITIHPIDDDARADHTLDFELRFLTPDEIIHFASEEGYRYSRAFASEAMTRGDRCFGILDQGHLVCYCWYAYGAAPVFEDIEVLVDSPLIYGYNAYTDQAYRGRGLHILGINSASSELRREGCTAIVAYIESDNLAPLMAARRMGERFVGFVVLFRAFGRFRWFATSGCRKAGFRVRRRAGESDRVRKITGKTQRTA
jgi:hypothetical protein